MKIIKTFTVVMLVLSFLASFFNKEASLMLLASSGVLFLAQNEKIRNTLF